MSDYPDFYVKKTVVARKQHRCCECHRKMKVGERHQVVTGKWDELCRFRTCRLCLKLREIVSTSDIYEYENWSFTCLYEEIADYGNELFHHMAERISALHEKEKTHDYVKNA